MPPSIAKFWTGADAIQMFVGLHSHPSPTLPGDTFLLEGRSSGQRVSQTTLIALPSVFSHTAFRLIEMLSITQHGEFITSSRRGNFQTIVEIGGHVCQRQLLAEAELQHIQQLYQQIDLQVLRWRSST
ncbi:MAG: hypothetical protein KME45_04240 [Stenomitos rutilans HA7619-LM2]|jgi:hypothetical protein|nr:hypothetical protein [Stenomitos rutilans HA7619-LM2]